MPQCSSQHCLQQMAHGGNPDVNQRMSRLRELWCIHTMEYYSATKRNTFESASLEPIVQSEASQKEKDRYHIYHIYMGSRKMAQMVLCAG